MEAKFNELVEKNNKALEGKVKLVPKVGTNENGEVEYEISYYSFPCTITRQKSSVGNDYFMVAGCFTNTDGAKVRYSQRLSTSDEDQINYYKGGFLSKIMRDSSVQLKVRTRLMYGYKDGRIFGGVVLLLADNVKKFIKLNKNLMGIIEDSICKGKFFDIPLEKHEPREDDFEIEEI